MMMRKVYTTPAHFTMLLLKFFNLLLIFLSRPYLARNRCRYVGLAGGGFLDCGLFWAGCWGASGPLFKVDHWLGDFPRFGPVSGSFLGASGPLFKVDHWLGDFPGFCPVSGSFLGASGPLFKVDHWLGTFPGFRPVSGEFLGASGPLSKVVHWLGDFPRFGPVSGSFLGASGPLFRVVHWLGIPSQLLPCFLRVLRKLRVFPSYCSELLGGFAG